MASDIKWIKITTDMFDDEKIDFISSLPEGDSLIVIWIRLLTMAGKNNAGGFIFLTENIPYTDDMLAHKFKKSTNIVKLAFETFERLGMVNFDEEGKIMIINWGKHQSVEGMDRVRELTRVRVAKHRELKDSTNNKDIDKELDLDIEQINVTVTLPSVTDKKTIPYQEIVDQFNIICSSLPKVQTVTDTRKATIKRYWKQHSQIEWFIDFFEQVEESDLLAGRKGVWKATFDWIFKPANFVKIQEGNYINREPVKEISYIEQEALNRRKVMEELAKRNGRQNDKQGIAELSWNKI